MVEIRMHGRGGQGTVVATKILASSLLKEGRYTQAFPEFGVERRGAPVVAFARIGDPGQIVNLRCKIYEPDHVVVLDPTLLTAVDVTAGLREGGWVIINTVQEPEELDLASKEKYRIVTLDARAVAVKHRIGSRVAPIVNTAILGAIAAVTELVGIDSVVESIMEEAPIHPERNAGAAKEMFEIAKERLQANEKTTARS
jgi:2-oxoacid:acceptor oxidoreductase gamma subunit (pyruvate/2-ketoisovalerate family)